MLMLCRLRLSIDRVGVAGLVASLLVISRSGRGSSQIDWGCNLHSFGVFFIIGGLVSGIFVRLYFGEFLAWVYFLNYTTTVGDGKLGAENGQF
jgi:hypothetical protein